MSVGSTQSGSRSWLPSTAQRAFEETVDALTATDLGRQMDVMELVLGYAFGSSHPTFIKCGASGEVECFCSVVG